MEDRERWQHVERAVEDHFARLEGIGTPAPLGDLEALAPVDDLSFRLERFLQTSEGEGLLDRPLEDQLGELLNHAVTEGALAVLGPGDRVGPYRIEAWLGEGGMGTVFEARRADGSFEQSVALKVLHRSPMDEQAHRRFLQERQILAGLRHPNIARLLDGGVIRGMPYLVMERVQGLPLVEYCESQKLGRDERLRLLLQACDAIRHAHREGVVHRDLKPSNLLVEEGPLGAPRTVVLDFGIARIDEPGEEVTVTGQIFGTPGYMSPEQASGATVDARSDVYALGVVLYELLAGQRPFEGEAHQILEQLVTAEPIPLRRRDAAVPADLETLVATCLARSPEERYGSVRELVEDLERFLAGEPIVARPVGWLGRGLRLGRRYPRLAAFSVVMVLIALFSLTLTVVLTLRHANSLEVERNAAVAARQDAEGLAEFLLDDLHSGLDRLGRLDLLEDAARKSIEFYDRQPVIDPSLEVIEGRAKEYSNAGQVLEEQGDVDAALEAYERSLGQWANKADHPRGLVGRSRSHIELASSLAARGEIEPALGHVRQAVDLSRELSALSQPPEGWSVVHFRGLALAGWVEREAGGEARALLEEALVFAEEQVATSEGETAASWRHNQAVALSYLGLFFYEEGDLGRAQKYFESARDECSALVEEAPANREMREELQLVSSHLGSVYWDLGAFEKATAALETSIGHAQWLVEQEPGNASWSRELAVAYSQLGGLRAEQGDLKGALEGYSRSQNLIDSLYRRFPENSSYANDLAWDLLETGRIERRLGQPEVASEHFERAVHLLATARQQGATSPYFLDTEAQALLELGRTEAAQSLLQRLAEIGWDDPDLEALAARNGLAVDGSPQSATPP